LIALLLRSTSVAGDPVLILKPGCSHRRHLRRICRLECNRMRCRRLTRPLNCEQVAAGPPRQETFHGKFRTNTRQAVRSGTGRDVSVMVQD